MIYEANGLPDLARECYEQLIAMRSNDARVWYRLAMLHDDQGNVGEAVQSVRRAIDLDGSYGPAHWRLGYWLLDAGEFDAAEASFRRVIELEHSSLAAWFG